jgi:hypothetical protein
MFHSGNNHTFLTSAILAFANNSPRMRVALCQQVLHNIDHAETKMVNRSCTLPANEPSSLAQCSKKPDSQKVGQLEFLALCQSAPAWPHAVF